MKFNSHESHRHAIATVWALQCALHSSFALSMTFNRNEFQWHSNFMMIVTGMGGQLRPYNPDA